MCRVHATVIFNERQNQEFVSKVIFSLSDVTFATILTRLMDIKKINIFYLWILCYFASTKVEKSNIVFSIIF
jgi:hypothetical protein